MAFEVKAQTICVTYTKLHSKIERGDQKDSDGGVQNRRTPIVLAGYPRETKFRFAGGGSRADAPPTDVGTRKLYE